MSRHPLFLVAWQVMVAAMMLPRARHSYGSSYRSPGGLAALEAAAFIGNIALHRVVAATRVERRRLPASETILGLNDTACGRHGTFLYPPPA
jgi:hypothetical protein